MQIELLQPGKDDETWRVKMDDGLTPRPPMTTRIKLSTSTKDVVKLLHSMHRGARITAGKLTLHPKPPGGLPPLHSSQQSKD